MNVAILLLTVLPALFMGLAAGIGEWRRSWGDERNGTIQAVHYGEGELALHLEDARLVRAVRRENAGFVQLPPETSLER